MAGPVTCAVHLQGRGREEEERRKRGGREKEERRKREGREEKRDHRLAHMIS
jgi:hypothetical protein